MKFAFLYILAIVSLPFCPGQAAEGTPSPVPSRHRAAFATLSVDAQNRAKICQNLSKKLDEAIAEERPPIARQLLSQAVELTSSNPDFFLGWVWQAQAALTLDERERGRIAGESMIALGVADNRLPGVRQLVEDLRKRGWVLPAAASVAKPGMSDEGFSPADKNLSDEDRLEFDTLGQLALVAEQEADEQKRQAKTVNFFNRSKVFLSRHPDEERIWLLWAHFCARDDRTEEGIEAARNLKRLGGVASSDPVVHQVMIELNLKGWLGAVGEHGGLAVEPRGRTNTTLPFALATAYEGTIREEGHKAGDGTPITVHFIAPECDNGTVTYGSSVGNTIVKFSGEWANRNFNAKTGDVVSKPDRVRWQSESFTLEISEDGKTATYTYSHGKQKSIATLSSK